MFNAFPPAKLVLIAKKISPRHTIPLLLAIKHGVNRFSKLAKIYQMSSRTLSKTLANLEKEEIIVKADDQSYNLTAKGEELAVHAEGIAEWLHKFYT
jgi:DNA-binding HxlR family transcriptional regulator